MARKIEKLLHIVSEMQMLEKENAMEKQAIQFMPDELADSDLDRVAAALQEPNMPDFFRKDRK